MVEKLLPDDPLLEALAIGRHMRDACERAHLAYVDRFSVGGWRRLATAHRAVRLAQRSWDDFTKRRGFTRRVRPR